MAYEMPITKIIEQNAIKDIQAAEDAALFAQHYGPVQSPIKDQPDITELYMLRLMYLMSAEVMDVPQPSAWPYDLQPTAEQHELLDLQEIMLEAVERELV